MRAYLIILVAIQIPRTSAVFLPLAAVEVASN